jgi:hypothetical protein
VALGTCWNGLWNCCNTTNRDASFKVGMLTSGGLLVWLGSDAAIGFGWTGIFVTMATLVLCSLGCLLLVDDVDAGGTPTAATCTTTDSWNNPGSNTVGKPPKESFGCGSTNRSSTDAGVFSAVSQTLRRIWEGRESQCHTFHRLFAANIACTLLYTAVSVWRRHA